MHTPPTTGATDNTHGPNHHDMDRSPSPPRQRPEPPEPTPTTDPHGYLALFKFNRKLPRCPRTGMPVSYSDIGDPNGVPVLFVPPSGCTRWFAAPQDPLAAGYAIRLIVVDRPGIGAVPMVPLAERIETSCMHIESVLEHLDVKVAHLVTTSAGVYYALRLLSSHPSIFVTGLAPPPQLYLVSPWSPPLPATDPLAYRQLLDWIPDGLITTQELTMPYIIPAVKGAEEAYGATTKAVGAAVSAVKSWFEVLSSRSAASSAAGTRQNSASSSPQPHGTTILPDTESASGIPVPDADANVDPETEPETEGERRRLWAPSAKYLTTDYLYAEDFRGIGQEHLLCLNRGGINTGPTWFVTELDAVAQSLRQAQCVDDVDDGKDGKKVDKLDINVWWGGQDGMVPKNGQEWLNKALSSHPAEITLVTHFVEDGDHGDLMLRAQGIGEVYLAIITSDE